MAIDKIAPTDKLRIFKSTIPSMRMVLSGGKTIDFIKGRYYTKEAAQIEELEYEISRGHAYLYVDPAEFEIVSEDRDPMVALRKQVRAELIAEAERAGNVAFGEALQVRMNPTSTRDIAPVALGSGTSGDSVRAVINSKVK